MTSTIEPTLSDRMHAALRLLIRAEFPRLTYLGCYEYTVQSTDGVTVSARPTDTTISLPELARVPIRLPLGTVTPVLGTHCLVAFINGDPTRPAMVSIDQTPVLPMLFAARATDPVVAGPFAGTIVAGSSTVRIG